MHTADADASLSCLQHAAHCACVTCLKAVTGDWISGQLSTRHEETGKTRGLQSEALPTMPIYAQQSHTHTISDVSYTHAFCNLSLIFNFHSRANHPCRADKAPHTRAGRHTQGVLYAARKERKQNHETHGLPSKHNQAAPWRKAARTVLHMECKCHPWKCAHTKRGTVNTFAASDISHPPQPTPSNLPNQTSHPALHASTATAACALACRRQGLLPAEAAAA